MRIIELTINNHKDVVELFGEEITNYYFIVDDLLKNNYQEEFFHVYGEYDGGKLVSILLNNFNNITYYSKEDRNVEAYENILNKLSFTKLSGPSNLMEKFIPYVNVEEDTLSYMGVVKNIIAERKYKDIPVNIINTEEEVGMQYDLLMSTEEYIGCLPENKNEYIISEIKRVNETSDRTAYLSVDDEMISSCSTVREGDNSAIVIGVVTNPKYRNKGYSTEVLIGLFNMLLKEGRYPYLFYNNPAARSVYKKIGLTEVCEWRVIECMLKPLM